MSMSVDDEVDEVDVERLMTDVPVRGAKTIVSTLRRTLNAAKNRRDKADLQVKQLEKVISHFMKGGE